MRVHADPYGASRERKIVLAAAATALNLALIAGLSLSALGFDDLEDVAAPPTIYLEIEPRPLLRDERPRPPVAAPAQPEASDSRAPSDSTPQASRRPDPAYQGRAAPIQPRMATQPSASAAPNAWRVDPTDRRGAMARSLRLGATGCTSPELLNEAERRYCRQRLGERAATAPPISGTGNPERDAAFAREGARRLAEWEARRRPLSGGVGVVGPADCVGSNLGIGCAGAHMPDVPGVDMRQGARTTHNSGEQRRIGGDRD